MFTVPTTFEQCIPYFQQVDYLCEKINELQNELATTNEYVNQLEQRVEALENKT